MGDSSMLQSSQRSAAGRRRAILFRKGSCSCAIGILGELHVFPLRFALGRKHFHAWSVELQIPPLRYASVGMTKERAALSFRFDAEDVEQQIPPLRYASVGNGYQLRYAGGM